MKVFYFTPLQSDYLFHLTSQLGVSQMMTAQTILHAEIGNVSTPVLWTDLVHLLPSVRLLITTLCALVLMVSLALHILDVLRVSLPP